jgi:hypothetical protein
MEFLWSPKREDELARWLAEYFDKPVETFTHMEQQRLWDVYRKVFPKEPPVSNWVSARYH